MTSEKELRQSHVPMSIKKMSYNWYKAEKIRMDLWRKHGVVTYTGIRKETVSRTTYQRVLCVLLKDVYGASYWILEITIGDDLFYRNVIHHISFSGNWKRACDN